MVLCAEPCSANYQNLLPHLSVEEAIQLKADSEEVYEQHVVEGRASMDDLGSRRFWPQSIQQQTGKVLRIKKKAIIMNASEFKEFFGKDPLMRFTRNLGSMLVPSSSGPGEMEEVWLFRWQPTHLRTVSLTEWVQCETGSQLLSPEAHYFAKQADEAMASYFENLNGKHQLAALDEKLPTLFSMADKIGAKVEGLSPGKHLAVVVPAAVPGSKLSSHGSVDDLVADHSGPTPHDVWGAAIAEAAPPKAQKRRPSAAPSGSPPLKRLAPPAPEPQEPLAGLQRTASQPALEHSETGSVTSKMTTGTRGMLQDPSQEVMKWVDRLDIADALTKAVGVQKHHALVAEQKLRSKGHEADARKLKDHIKTIAMAELLNPERIMSTDDCEYEGAVAAVSRKVAFPSPVQVGMVQRMVDKLGRLVGDAASFEKAFEVAWPWSAAPCGEQKCKFDPLQPRCCDALADMEQKIDLFAQGFWKVVVASLVCKASSDKGQQLLLKAMRMMLDKTEAVVELGGDMSDAEASLTCEILTASRGVSLLIDLTSIVYEADLAGRLADVQVLSESQGNADTIVLQMTSLALADTAPFADNLELLAKKKASLKELHPIVQKHMVSMGGMGLVDIEGACNMLDEIFADVPRIAHGLGEQFKTSFEDSVLEAVGKVAAKIAEDPVASRTSLQRATRMLAEASTVFPLAGTVSEWASDVGSRLAEVTHKTTIDSFVAITDSIVDVPTLLNKLSEVQGALHSLGAMPSSGAVASKVASLWTLVLEACLTNMMQEQLGPLLQLAEKVEANATGDKQPERAKQLEYLQKAFALREATAGLRAKVVTDDGGIDEDRDLLSEEAVQVELSRLQAQKTELSQVAASWAPEAGDLAGLNEVIENAAGLISNLVNVLLEKLGKKGDEISANIADVAGGVSGGAMWKAALSEKDLKDWEKTVAVAENTIIKEAKVAGMRKGIDLLDKASTQK